MERIVVGVDGSPQSKKALAWAVEQARVHDATLEIVYAYGPPEDYNPYAQSYIGTTASTIERLATDERRWRDQRRAQAQERAEQVLQGVIHDVPGTEDVRVKPLVITETRPPRALIEHARGADLLVIGSRGRGGFAGLVLGSVSQQCAQHAPCPVVIVRPTG